MKCWRNVQEIIVVLAIPSALLALLIKIQFSSTSKNVHFKKAELLVEGKWDTSFFRFKFLSTLRFLKILDFHKNLPSWRANIYVQNMLKFLLFLIFIKILVPSMFIIL